MKLCYAIFAALFLVGCAALMRPVEGPQAGQRADGTVEVPVPGADGTTVVVTTPGEERPVTVADEAIDTAVSIGSMFLPNPMLWGLLAQLGHAAVGGVFRRRQATAPTA